MAVWFCMVLPSVVSAFQPYTWNRPFFFSAQKRKKLMVSLRHNCIALNNLIKSCLKSLNYFVTSWLRTALVRCTQVVHNPGSEHRVRGLLHSHSSPSCTIYLQFFHACEVVTDGQPSAYLQGIMLGHLPGAFLKLGKVYATNFWQRRMLKRICEKLFKKYPEFLPTKVAWQIDATKCGRVNSTTRNLRLTDFRQKLGSFRWTGNF